MASALLTTANPINAVAIVLRPPKSLTNFNVFMLKSNNILANSCSPPLPRTSS